MLCDSQGRIKKATQRQPAALLGGSPLESTHHAVREAKQTTWRVHVEKSRWRETETRQPTASINCQTYDQTSPQMTPLPQPSSLAAKAPDIVERKHVIRLSSIRIPDPENQKA